MYAFQIKTGFALTIICICVNLLGAHTWVYAMFDLGHVPAWQTPLAGTTTLSPINVTIP